MHLTNVFGSLFAFSVHLKSPDNLTIKCILDLMKYSIKLQTQRGSLRHIRFFTLK